MRLFLLTACVLAACAPEISTGEQAQMECERGGISRTSPGYADCYSRIYASMNAGEDQRRLANRERALRMSQQPMIQPIRQGGVYVPQVRQY